MGLAVFRTVGRRSDFSPGRFAWTGSVGLLAIPSFGIQCVQGTARHRFSLLKPTGHVMHQQFNIQQLYALPTLYLCVLYLSENKQRLVSLTA